MSLDYVVCCNTQCAESGGIKKTMHKCSKCGVCRKSTKPLSARLLNEKYCIKGNFCYNEGCSLLHPNKNHQSPPFISPCPRGELCNVTECIYLHPDPKCGAWLTQIN